MSVTTLPSWTAHPTEGRATHTVAVPAALRGFGGLPPAAALLAVHLRVVGLLAGETEVATACGDTVVRADLGAGSWRELCATLPQPAELVCGHPGLVAEYSTETITLSWDRALFSAAHVGRIGGYLLRAVLALAADPDAAPLAADLLSAGERRHQLHDRGGPVRELPPRRFHELFAERAAWHPDAVAVLHNGERWSYRRLDQAANQVAHALLAAGLAAEDIVAVCAHRGPRWLAAVIGILRAGGAYLPVEPDFPPARTATLLERSRSRHVLTDGSYPDGAHPATVLHLEHDVDGRPTDDPGVVVGAGQLAYVYFTSGSTGLPKGAMCEHAGMLNHLLAKVSDLGLGPDDVVVQNAQATFDISLWQAIAPLLVGGATVIVDRAEILDVRRFLRTIAEAGATVLQVVPSYLDIVLRHGEQEHGEREPEHERSDLGRVRCVSVTGEAISRLLVARFFDRHPGLELVNAYGATEASDDTTHEIMTAVPAEDLVPVGVPVANVTVTVVGPDDRLVPLGAPGEITFSGVCVGRGYVNDPQRTAEAFGDDPLRPGVRRYRTGDYGRWLPTGHLEFHGRRDEQVKIHGVRIELGEVQARILEHPAVRAASVVVVPLPGPDRHSAAKSLVGFYTGTPDLGPAELDGHLRTLLPASAVPARLCPVDALPLNANGKVDKRRLVELAQHGDDQEPAGTAERRTPTEDRIARAWAAALGLPADRIGREDHFFDLGGSSLAALRVVAALDGLITLDGLVRSPVLAELAAGADGLPEHRTPSGLLRLLGGPARGARLAVLCLPYAAGSAISFQPLAAALTAAAPDVAVYGLQAPGHDLTRRGETPLELDELAKLLAEEARGLGVPLVLWGHCAGAPLALECAARLGGQVRRVFVAAKLLASDQSLAREIAGVVAADDLELAAELADQGGLGDPEPTDPEPTDPEPTDPEPTDLDPALDTEPAPSPPDTELPAATGPAELGADELAFIGRAYRHDTRIANQYLLDAPHRWASTRLDCPVTVVVSSTDPLTVGYTQRHRDWRVFAERVELAELHGGGHLFCRTRPEQTAALIVGAVGG